MPTRSLLLLAVVSSSCAHLPMRDAWERSEADRFEVRYHQRAQFGLRSCTLVVLEDQQSGACFISYRCGAHFTFAEVSALVCDDDRQP